VGTAVTNVLWYGFWAGVLGGCVGHILYDWAYAQYTYYRYQHWHDYKAPPDNNINTTRGRGP
jgi:hypothetical protein